MGIDTSQTGTGFPVFSCFRRAERRNTHVPISAATNIVMASQVLSPNVGCGMMMPRLLTKMLLAMLMACFGPGSGLRTSAYQMKICKSSGMLRTISM